MINIHDWIQVTNDQVLRTEKLDAATSQMVGTNDFSLCLLSFAVIKTCVWIKFSVPIKVFNELAEVEGLSFWKDPAPGKDFIL